MNAMNAMLSATIPLPAILDQSVSAGSGRRHRIDTYCLTPLDVERFNDLLLRLGRRQAPLNCDQVVTAARELCDCNTCAAEPPSILERMHRVETASQMIQDPDWEAASEAVNTARLVIDYAQGNQNLIPDWVPTVGRLDDAIVVDAAWPRLADEVESYLDFCRLRGMEAGRRGDSIPTQRFNRTDWEQSLHDEAALATHQRDVRERSYLPESPAFFRIH